MYLNSSVTSEPPAAEHQPNVARTSFLQQSTLRNGVGDRAVIRIRNIRESTVYHLTFDGDVGLLTGYQLKTHVSAVSGIPYDRQILTFNGQPIHDQTIGYDINLRSGSMVILDLVNIPVPSITVANVKSSSNVPSTPACAPYHQRESEGRVSRESVRERSRLDKSGASESTASYSMRYDMGNVRGSENETLRKNDLLTSAVQERSIEYATYGASGINDGDDSVVEVEEETCDWEPTNIVDIDENNLMQQDYVWQLEQVRFETERIHRENEIKRQQQDLEYEASVLERERIELERRTRAEKLKLTVMQNTMHDEMMIRARITSDTHLLH